MKREVAWRIFAKEYNYSDLFISSEEDRDPNYLITPTGARCNRLFAVGVLTETEKLDNNAVKAKLSDPTGLFTLYAGKYQEKERNFLKEKNEPYFAAVTGKANAFESDDGRIFTSIRPERIDKVTAKERDNWLITTAKKSIKRLKMLKKAKNSGFRGEELIEYLKKEGCSPKLAKGISEAIDFYKIELKEIQGIIKKGLSSFIEIEKDKKTSKDVVKEILKNSEKDEGMNYSELINKAKKDDFSEKEIEEAINNLLDEGRCYEPEVGKIRLV